MIYGNSYSLFIKKMIEFKTLKEIIYSPRKNLNHVRLLSANVKQLARNLGKYSSAGDCCRQLPTDNQVMVSAISSKKSACGCGKIERDDWAGGFFSRTSR